MKKKLSIATGFITLFAWMLVLVSQGYAEVYKKAQFAGALYPEGRSDLNMMLDEFFALEDLPEPDRDTRIIIAPNASLLCSGPVAGYAFQKVKGANINTVIILTDSNHYSFETQALFPAGSFISPLGKVAVNSALARKIVEYDESIVFDRTPYTNEHAVETLLPFIQKTIPDAMIVPIICGGEDPESFKILAAALASALEGEENYLVVVGGVLSQNLSYEEALLRDEEVIRAIQAEDVEKLFEQIQGQENRFSSPVALCAALLLRKSLELKGLEVYKYANSGNIVGDKSRVVGYLSAGFSHEPPSSVAPLKN